MTPSLRAAVPSELQNLLFSALRSTGALQPLDLVRSQVSSTAPIFIVGGFIRDCLRHLLHGTPFKPADLDIVIDANLLQPRLSNLPGTVLSTPFGGIRWWPEGASHWVDIWTLSDTVWLRNRTDRLTVFDYLAGVDLNINRVAFDLRNQSILDAGCYSGVSNRTIRLDATVRVPDLDNLELARALLTHLKTGYSLSEDILNRIYHASNILSTSVFAHLSTNGYSIGSFGRLQRLITTIQEHRTSETPRNFEADERNSTVQHIART